MKLEMHLPKSTKQSSSYAQCTPNKVHLTWPREEEDEKECVNARADWGHAKVDEVPWGHFLNDIHKIFPRLRANKHSESIFVFCLQ